MEIVINAQGQIRCLYQEVIDLRKLGKVKVRRASHVEPDAQGLWWVDLNPVKGPLLGPFWFRSQALQAEQTWLETHWLARPLSESP